MRQNVYYNHVDGFDDVFFVMCSFRTKSNTVVYKNGTTKVFKDSFYKKSCGKSCYDFNECAVEDGLWKRISYKEAMQMLKPKKIEDKITYYLRFGPNSLVLFSYNHNTHETLSYNKYRSKQLSSHDLNDINTWVAYGDFYEIGKTQANDIINKWEKIRHEKIKQNRN